MPESKPTHSAPDSVTSARQTDVFAIYGVEPEVQAYAMAKYSRSALSMKESLREISEQKAEKFLNTFYFQYGHRSIADLAHIAMAVERLSLLAAVVLEDEQRWDGQERSTRYQDFSHPDYYVPAFDDSLTRLYRETIEFLFDEYRFFSGQMFQKLCEQVPRPAEMKQESYDRTLRARAFDIARYLLPLATNTSLGQIVSARTLESQISKLLASRHAEVRDLGRKLKNAAVNPAFSLHDNREVRPAPTLVKYADPNQYLAASREELEAAAKSIMGDAPIAAAPEVDLLDDEPMEIELATSLLYEHCAYPYRQIREKVESLSDAARSEIVDLGTRHRGPHDELLKAYSGGQKFRFDILMDAGGFRDLHRHRHCVQLHQEFGFEHGFDIPEDIANSPHQERYRAVMQRVSETAQQIAAAQRQAGREWRDVCYLMPLAYRKRTLFKMDFAEVVYISELRTTPAGHFSYRNIAYQMYEVVAKRHPSLAKYFRVCDVREPVDLLKR